MTKKSQPKPVAATERQMAFAREYLANGGHGTKALAKVEPEARKETLSKRASQFLRTQGVQNALAHLRAHDDITSIISFAEILRGILAVAQNKKTPAKDKIHAYTELARLMSYGAPSKVEVSGPNGGPIQAVSMAITPETAQAITLHLLGVGAPVEAEGEDVT